MMSADKLVTKLKSIAGCYKTLYVMGCFGAPMTAANKERYIAHHEYNRRPGPKAAIQAATADTFGFDCVCLVKGVLWNWRGDKNHIYGGATYASNGVPDIGADSMIQVCKEVSTDFSKIVPGELLWKSDHVGIYIGNAMAVECTPAWNNCVQITDVQNIMSTGNRPARTWVKHGKLPYVKYGLPLPFEDVSESNWFYDAVRSMYEKGIMKGVDNTHFKPNGTLTRAEFAQLVQNLFDKGYLK